MGGWVNDEWLSCIAAARVRACVTAVRLPPDCPRLRLRLRPASAQEIRDVYKLWRPTPMYRARRLEKMLDTPARIYYK